MLRIDSLSTEFVGPASLTVEAGECVSIMGPSGSGKSLFLRAIADLDPNRGRVWLDQTERATVAAPDWRARVMLVPAESGWWADRVSDHFDRENDPGPWLSAIGLPEALDWSVHRLSTGERQRLAIVRALVRAPLALLLDEPTASLDASAIQSVETLIREQCQNGMPVILVTHDAAQAARLARRHFWMDAGQLSEPEAGRT